MNLLDEINANKRVELVDRKAAKPLATLCGQALRTPPPPDFVASLRSVPIGLIAEVKRRSPSAGPIREPFDPSAIAKAYEQGGAQAISTLMDEKYFGGGESDFRTVRAAVKIPLLYKEFVVDPWQLWHARSIGASAALLIVACLDQGELLSLMAVCREAGLAALVEVHDEEETHRAVDAGAEIIGVNNRNLKTFKVSLETTHRLSALVPPGTLLVGESGIYTAEDVVRLKQAGAQAVLVGESLLRQGDVVAAVRALMGKAWASS